MVATRKLASKEALRDKMKVSLPAFNDWQRPDVLAVPQTKMKLRVITNLNLTKAEREAFDEAIEAQSRAEKTAPPEAEPEPEVVENGVTTSYTHLPLAMGLMQKIPKYAPVLDLLPLWRGKDEDPTVEGWFRIGDEMLETLRSHGADGLGDSDAGLGGGKLEALKKKGRKR